MNGTISKKTELSKRGKKPSTYRRIVTGNVNGKSVVQSDERMQAYEFKTVPGYKHTLIWSNAATPDLSKEQRFDGYPDSVVPGPGGTSLHFVTFPPGSVFADPSFDGEAARDEALIRLRGLAGHFEKEDPAMHKTNTVDYAVVYDGEIWLELDNSETLYLERGDVVVQNGTRHAWRNKGTEPVTMLFFLNGAITSSHEKAGSMTQSTQERNKALVLQAFDLLFNKRDYAAAEKYWSPHYIQHSAHIAPGREGLFNLIKSIPPTLKYEPGTIIAEGDFVIVHGRFSGFGQLVNWIAADILRIKDGILVEHWDVIQDEASREQSKSGLPMFGDKFGE